MPNPVSTPRPKGAKSKEKTPGGLAPPGTGSDKKLTAEECDKKLAQLFGGSGAVVGSTHDPLTLGSFDKAKEFAAEAAKKGFTMTITGERAFGHGPDPNPGGTFPDLGGIIHVYAESRGMEHGALYAPAGGHHSRITGGNQTMTVSYGTGLIISFVHTRPSKERGTNAMGSERIGDIGGSRGNSSGYIHSHLVFSHGGKRVDPRKIFCGW